MKTQRGYALPLSLCVAGVTLMLGLSAAQMTNGDLHLANHQYYQERARQMADYGLEYCVSHQVLPGQQLPLNSLSSTHPFDNVSVKAYGYGAAGSPVSVPQGFEYWVAEGRACEGPNAASLASARVGALVRFGMPAGSAGAQIRSLVVTSLGGDAVDYVVRDGVTNQQVQNESVCSSEYDGSPSLVPLPFAPAQASVLDLGNVGSFAGNFRVPRGVSQSVVHVNSAAAVPVSQDGGPLNVPTFSPPAGLAPQGVLVVADDFDGVLPSGHYTSMELPAGAKVHLKGTYHFDVLKLSDNTPLDAGGTLQVNATDSAKVFVGELSLGRGRLGLNNTHGSAQNFRFTLKALPPPEDPATDPPGPVLNFFLPNGGGVALVAGGHRISVQADSTSREIRGAFSARALQVKFPAAGLGVDKKPLFVYDVSATTARRSTAPRGGGAGNGGPVGAGDGPPERGDIGDTGTVGGVQTSGSDGGQDHPGSEGGNNDGEPTTGGNPRSANTLTRAAGIEPMILSRQAL